MAPITGSVANDYGFVKRGKPGIWRPALVLRLGFRYCYASCHDKGNCAMPTYEYACSACRHEFEAYQPITSAPVKKCPKCGKNKVQRLISGGAGILFKGSGFYATDYRSESYKSGAKADVPKSESKPETKSPAKAESKSEGKSDSKTVAAA